MNISNLDTQTFRVTSIKFLSEKYAIFTGIPIDDASQKRNSGALSISVKCKSDLLPILPSRGQIWKVEGIAVKQSFELNKYLVSQITFENLTHIECILPESGEELVRFIASQPEFKGIGEVKARRLWEHLGARFHTTLSKDTPETRKSLEVILKREYIDALFEGYAKYKNIASCGWMAMNRIPPEIQQRLLRFHGEKTIDLLKENPYRLIGFGMTFEEVDAMALDPHSRIKPLRNTKLIALSESEFCVQADDSRRLIAAYEYALRREISKGHTYADLAEIEHKATKLLGGYKPLGADALLRAHKSGQFVVQQNGKTLHPVPQLVMETAISARLLKLARLKNLYNAKADLAYRNAAAVLPYELTTLQSEAVIASLDTAVSCITGGAGTGKTTVLRTLLRAYDELGFEIYAVALSGRAAMRLHESTGFITKTIAKFLREEPINGSKPTLLVIDEASMLDLPTMYRIITHINPSVRIIFTGDPDQLPPIGCGKVLADIVVSGSIANTRLDIVKRQDATSGIPEYGLAVNQGTVPGELSVGGITFHETNEDSIEVVCSELFCLSPKTSRVMAATKEMVRSINIRIQNRLNSTGTPMQFSLGGEVMGLDLRQGDTILFTQNNYEKHYQNGSLGTLLSVKQDGQTLGSVLLDTGEVVSVTQSTLNAMELGYAITLHKAQGSQFPRIVIALTKGVIVDRAWIYTAITRAENEIHIVGSQADFEFLITNQSNASIRRSYLQNLLSNRH
jgi:exodeoxyribonuclease V alpha subunit